MFDNDTEDTDNDERMYAWLSADEAEALADLLGDPMESYRVR